MMGRSRVDLGRRGWESWARWLVRGLVLLVLAGLLLLGVRDVVRSVVGGVPAGRAPAVAAVTGYPKEAAGVFAARFALVYLTFDSAHPERHRQAVQPYLAGGLDGSLGWDGQGRQTAITSLPSGIEVRDEHRALVTVAALVDGGRWIYLAVPVLADQGRLGVVQLPSLVPPPALPAWSPPPGPLADGELSSQLQPSLTAFFKAYAASSRAELGYYTAPGAGIEGLGGQVQFRALSALSVEAGGPDRRSAVAAVRWLDPTSGAGLVQRYRLELVRAGDRWLVGEVSPGE